LWTSPRPQRSSSASPVCRNLSLTARSSDNVERMSRDWEWRGSSRRRRKVETGRSSRHGSRCSMSPAGESASRQSHHQQRHSCVSRRRRYSRANFNSSHRRHSGTPRHSPVGRKSPTKALVKPKLSVARKSSMSPRMHQPPKQEKGWRFMLPSWDKKKTPSPGRSSVSPKTRREPRQDDQALLKLHGESGPNTEEKRQHRNSPARNHCCSPHILRPDDSGTPVDYLIRQAPAPEVLKNGNLSTANGIRGRYKEQRGTIKQNISPSPKSSPKSKRRGESSNRNRSAERTFRCNRESRSHQRPREPVGRSTPRSESISSISSEQSSPKLFARKACSPRFIRSFSSCSEIAKKSRAYRRNRSNSHSPVWRRGWRLPRRGSSLFSKSSVRDARDLRRRSRHTSCSRMSFVRSLSRRSESANSNQRTGRRGYCRSMSRWSSPGSFSISRATNRSSPERSFTSVRRRQVVKDNKHHQKNTSRRSSYSDFDEDCEQGMTFSMLRIPGGDGGQDTCSYSSHLNSVFGKMKECDKEFDPNKCPSENHHRGNRGKYKRSASAPPHHATLYEENEMPLTKAKPKISIDDDIITVTFPDAGPCNCVCAENGEDVECCEACSEESEEEDCVPCDDMSPEVAEEIVDYSGGVTSADVSDYDAATMSDEAKRVKDEHLQLKKKQKSITEDSENQNSESDRKKSAAESDRKISAAESDRKISAAESDRKKSAAESDRKKSADGRKTHFDLGDKSSDESTTGTCTGFTRKRLLLLLLLPLLLFLLYCLFLTSCTSCQMPFSGMFLWVFSNLQSSLKLTHYTPPPI